MKEIVKQLLNQDGILLGYELEDCEHGRINGKEIHQFQIRPITKQDFMELWEHGRKHCSKFVIYVISGDLFCVRRPDMLNYETRDDAMYGEEDVLKGAKDISRELEDQFGKEAWDSEKRMLRDRIERAITHYHSTKPLGNERYNILFEY